MVCGIFSRGSVGYGSQSRRSRQEPRVTLEGSLISLAPFPLPSLPRVLLLLCYTIKKHHVDRPHRFRSSASAVRQSSRSLLLSGSCDSSILLLIKCCHPRRRGEDDPPGRLKIVGSIFRPAAAAAHRFGYIFIRFPAISPNWRSPGNR